MCLWTSRDFSFAYAFYTINTLGFMSCRAFFLAPVSLASEDFKFTTVAEDLDQPWGLAFLPDGTMLLTEKIGQLRVISGGRLDLGFGMFFRHDLRLRGIDCPELSTKAGEEAKVFVQSYIKEAQRIVVRSSRSDKYDRNLADVFVPAMSLVLENGTNTPRAKHGRAGVSTSEVRKDI